MRIGNDDIPFGPFVCDCEAFDRAQQAERAQEQAREDARQEIKRQKHIADLFRQSTIADYERNRTFENFAVTSGNAEALQIARKYVDTFGQREIPGLLFTGNVGLGKTHLSLAISLELLNREHSVIYGTVSSLLAQIRNTYDSDKISEWEFKNRLYHCGLLVIDEMGKEKVNEWVGMTIYDIINARYSLGKPMIITTNLSMGEIRAKYNKIENVNVGVGDALVDRIYEVCQGVQFTGTSWRKQSLGGGRND